MSSSFTYTDTTTFTLTHAKYITSKLATDLKRMQRFYGSPSDSLILQFETEVMELLKQGYLKSVTYGFKKNGKYIEPTLKYTADSLGNIFSEDDDPGRIRPNADTTGATFYSFLTYTNEWFYLSENEQETFKKGLPFERGHADEPTVDGYYSQDKIYSSGGRSLSRESVRSD